MADYDIGEAFQRVEEEMIASMSRNLKRHLKAEAEEGLNYTMWQAEQLAALQNFRKNNKKLFSGYFGTINGKIAEVLQKANETGRMDQEKAILKAIQKGFKAKSRAGAKSVNAQFFKINERKLNALIKATQKDMIKAETAMLRMANDEYRKIIFNADVYYSSGAGTLPQCVDMATRDFLSRGINCIEYRNGARVGIDAYARMALRTTQTRAYLQGEASKRDEWGVNTVLVNRRGVACPKCLQWVARVYYDDVWGSLPVPSPAKYPRLSDAIAGGLYHPNCKDSHTTYFEGVSEDPKPMTKEEVDEANRVYKLEQKQRYNERQIRKYKRLADGSADPENIERYSGRLKAWQAEQRRFVKANSDVLSRRYALEKVFPEPPSLTSNRMMGVDNSDDPDIIIEKRRTPQPATVKAVNTKAEPKVDALHPESIAGAKLGPEMSFKEAASGRVNPHYREGKRYQMNCQTCVVALEARLRGYDVVAKPYNPLSKQLLVASKIKSPWIDLATGKAPEYIANDALKDFDGFMSWLGETVKPGERYNLNYGMKGAKSRHVVTLCREKGGKLVIYDPQRDKLYPEEVFSERFSDLSYGASESEAQGGPEILRVDNLAFNTDIVDSILEKADE